jgi:adenosylcobinamide-GDP ribazoletransferase
MAELEPATVGGDGVVRSQFRACVAAFAFLTRLPVYRIAASGPGDLAESAAYFPLVGLVVALMSGLVYACATFFWPVVLAVILSTAATVLITGAFHEDALADALDGFGGGWNPEQILAIMKDSRVGSYALVGMILVIAAKIAALVSIATDPLASATTTIEPVLRALIAAHVLGRWSSVPLLWKYPYVRQAVDGERASAGQPFAMGSATPEVIVASVFALVITILVAGARSVGVIVIAVGITWLAGLYFRKRIGGITGDALGAVNQIVELSVYLVLAARV